MRAIAGGAGAGAVIAGLVLALGVTTFAWLALVLAVLAIVAGAVDYVLTHG